MYNEKQELENKSYGTSGLVFVGCLMLGLAAGFLTGNFLVGILGGLGIGFVAMALATANKGKGASGLAFIGCLMLGLALGFLFGNVVVGLFIGLGVAFIVMYATRQQTGQW